MATSEPPAEPGDLCMSPEIARWWEVAHDGHRRYMAARDAAARSAPWERIEVAAQRLAAVGANLVAPEHHDAAALDDVLDALQDVIEREHASLAAARTAKAVRLADRRAARAGRLRDRLEPAAQELAERWAVRDYQAAQDRIGAEFEAAIGLPPRPPRDQSLPVVRTPSEYIDRLRAGTLTYRDMQWHHERVASAQRKWERNE